MPSMTFAAVAATDQLQMVAHGLTTGDGPGTTIVAAGAGLSSSADYFVIVIDVDHVKLATSAANALAGTPVVNITSDISGMFGIGIPYRRARTYVANVSQVRATDLNAIEDALSGGKHGLKTKTIAGAAFAMASGTTYAQTTGGELQGTPLNAQASLGLNVGDRVLAVRLFMKDSATGPTTVRLTLVSTTAAGVQTSIANVTSSGAGTDQTLALTALTTTIAASNGYNLNLATILGAAQSTVRFAEIDYDHP